MSQKLHRSDIALSGNQETNELSDHQNLDFHKTDKSLQWDYIYRKSKGFILRAIWWYWLDDKSKDYDKSLINLFKDTSLQSKNYWKFVK